MKKDKLIKQFQDSCKFYCEYHEKSKTETAMICGNLTQVVLRIIEAVKTGKKSI